MKVNVKQKEFTPVTVEFTFETQDELDRFGSLMNYVPVDDFFHGRCLHESFKGVAAISKYIVELNSIMKDHVLRRLS